MRHLNLLIVTLFIPIVYIFEFLINSYNNGVPEAYDEGKFTFFIMKRAYYFYFNANKFNESYKEWNNSFKEDEYLKDKDSANRFIAFFSKGSQLINVTKKRKILNPYFI